MSGSTWEGGCQEGLASSTHTLLPPEIAAGCAGNDRELAPLGSQLEERGRGLAPGFPTLSQQNPASIFGETSQ